MHADLLLTNGRLLTFAGGSVRALAIRGDRILAVGEEAEIAPLRGPRTRVLDLRGRLALPGFTDSHVHLAALGGRLSEVRLESASSLQEALRLVAAHARKIAPGEWITGGGFDKNRWGDSFPTRHDLDRVVPDRPVALRSRDGHSVWANSLALSKCGIERATPAPEGGVILRDSGGEPTGLLQEAATGLLRSCPDFAERRPDADRLVAAQRFLLKQGVTSVHLMAEAPLFEDLQRLRARGRLLLRTTLYRGAGDLDDLVAAGLMSGLGDERLRFGGLKLLIDGALGSQTAWMFEPYENSPAGCGVPWMDPAAFHDIVRRAAGAGIACAIHAIGDRANAEVLDALEQVREFPTPLPHRIEHAQLLRSQDIARFARLGVVASMQPCHILGDIDSAERYWGRRSRYAYPIRSLLESGVTLAFGSDAPVETADPIKGVYAAVRRQTLDGRPGSGWYRREESISVKDALKCYSLGPAAATGESHLKGRLAPGCLADIVVLSRDITRLRGRALLDVRVEAVIVGGRVAYRRRSGSSPLR